MPVITVVNRKGGSGKSTLATHVAGYCANVGIPVMLGDIDRQQSAQAWLKLRQAQKPKAKVTIEGWKVDTKKMARVPRGVQLVVLDTPGGMQGFDLAKAVMLSDVVLIPVCNSVFDRNSAAACYAELLTLPRVASGRCKVAAVGMRLDGRTSAELTLKEWAEQIGLPFIGVLRESQAYVRCIEKGLTLFDLPESRVRTDLLQWEVILKWLRPFLTVEKPVVEDAKRAVVLKEGVFEKAVVPVEDDAPVGIARRRTVPPNDSTVEGVEHRKPVHAEEPNEGLITQPVYESMVSTRGVIYTVLCAWAHRISSGLGRSVSRVRVTLFRLLKSLSQGTIAARLSKLHEGARRSTFPQGNSAPLTSTL